MGLLRYLYLIWYHEVECDNCGKIFYRSRQLGIEKNNVCSMGCAMSFFSKVQNNEKSFK